MFYRIIALILLIHSISNARILRVPADYESIAIAVGSSEPTDTVLLSPGRYTDTVSVRHALVFASTFLFTNDTTTVSNTIWDAHLPSALINVFRTQVELIGLTFTAIGAPTIGRRVIEADSAMVRMRLCVFNGYFVNPSQEVSATIRARNLCKFYFSFCSVLGDSNSGIFLYTVTPISMLSITNSSFSSNGVRGSLVHMIYATPDTIILTKSSFTGRSRVLRLGSHSFELDSCDFSGFDADAFRLIGGGIVARSKVTNCVFRDSEIRDTTSCIFSIPNFNPNIIPYLIENCEFSNIRQIGRVPQSQLIYSSAAYPIIMRKCSFFNNYLPLGPALTLNPLTEIDSCRFINNTFQYLIQRAGITWPVNFRNCDFVNYAGTIGFLNIMGIDSVHAPDCYWGSTTGPQCALNPTGTGQRVVSYLNPFPFRTTPVFPDTRVEEPVRLGSVLPISTHLLDLHPNPFNATTTIKYTVAKSAKIELAVFDITGREVGKIVDFHQEPGEYSVKFDGTTLSTGTYFIRLRAGEFVQTRKMVLLK